MEERLKFIAACRDEEVRLAAICRQFGIGRKTGYMWLERYAEAGPLLLWLFGPVRGAEPHLADPERASGYLELERATVRWFLSIDRDDLPFTADHQSFLLTFSENTIALPALSAIPFRCPRCHRSQPRPGGDHGRPKSDARIRRPVLVFAA